MAHSQLTPREVEVVDLICDGHNTESIANQLGIANNTAGTHIKNIFTKMRVTSRLELVVRELKQRHARETETWKR